MRLSALAYVVNLSSQPSASSPQTSAPCPAIRVAPSRCNIVSRQRARVRSPNSTLRPSVAMKASSKPSGLSRPPGRRHRIIWADQ
jgi:hypothetical protein